MRKFRFFNKIYAYLLGYFWVSCPICGEYFGGHELLDGHFITTSIDKKVSGKGVCYKESCFKKAKEISIISIERRQQ